MTSSVDVPMEYLCPITNQLMDDPVMDREGNSYERTAILTWLKRSETSPITRAALRERDLIPNRALKGSIDAFRAANANAQLHFPAPRPQPNSALTGDDSAQQELVKVNLWHNENGECLLSIIPPAGDVASRAGVDVVCVIDVSGSMADEATVQNEKKEVEAHGLSLLDVVRHAARTVSKILGPNDRFAVVSFSDNAKVELPLTAMDPAGKELASKALDALHPGGQTNLWDGLQTGMDLVKDAAPEGRTKSVLLLTDGCPNLIPPRGHLPTMKQYIDRLGGVVPFTVNTFGFGYSLDSGVLNELAVEAGGMYVFIPDSGLVGTVFVNAVANLLSTMSSSVSVSVECEAPITQSSNLMITKFGGFGTIGGLQYGQTRDVYFKLNPAGAGMFAAPFAKVEFVVGGTKRTLTVHSELAGPAQKPSITAHAARTAFCVAVEASRRVGDAKEVEALIVKLQPLVGDHPLIAALLADLKGEVKLALETKECFTRWGRHYLPSLVRANELQQCNNFKDKSVQLYGAAFFAQVRDEGEAIFIKLPPPKGSRPRATVAKGGAAMAGGAGAPKRTAAPVQMNAYYNYSGGCVAPDCLVALLDGTTKRACEIRQGDRLLGGASVVCAVKIKAPAEGLEMVTLKGGLVISPYHPIRLAGEWVFPTDCAALARRQNHPEISCIHNFVLDSGHIAVVNGVEVCTFGHGFTDNTCIRHAFFGTQAVVDALQALPGYDQGTVVVEGFTRDPDTRRVTGLKKPSD